MPPAKNDRPAPNSQRARFALLRHHYGDARRGHWDLLLELDAAAERVATFKLAEDLSDLPPGESLTATVQPDHRRMYLDYSGPISGGRGEVEQIDAGELVRLNPPADSTAAVHFELRGRRISGRFTLTRPDNFMTTISRHP